MARRDLGTLFSAARFLSSSEARHCAVLFHGYHYTGDSRNFFKQDGSKHLAEAERRFKKATGQGFTAAYSHRYRHAKYRPSRCPRRALPSRPPGRALRRYRQRFGR
ncbi:hypothetical protein FXB40_11185 [Bradyrhizobium rifense]|uniref:Uncharacterized protein n=1 Tax=Bradyrhizobium rifense TaxID=515499 RepID=A0A5D3KI07_9BRAD|nr:hypothetical protein FXB40_11185 [Bradyrhizobium rifense]